jgi:hypothetical protein
MRARYPERYRIIGRIVYEDTAERPDADAEADGRGDHASGPART